jgi:tetratricopeptide (TPR) repeat protein
VKWTRGELTPAEEHFRRCLDLARRISDPESLSQSLMWLSQVAWYKGDFDAMRHYAHESIDAAPPDLPSPNRASAFTLLGIASTRQGRTAEARAELECALSIHRGADFSRGAIWTLQCLADLSHDEGKHGDSAQQHRESLDLCLAAENYWGIFEDVAGLLRLAIDLAMLEEAAALLVVADSLRTTFTVLPREGKWITDNQRELLERMSIKDTSARQLDPAIPEDLVEMVDIARRIATQMADRSSWSRV